jgi:hypothetical protein
MMWFDGWSLSDKIAVIASVVAFLQFLALMSTIRVMSRTGQRQLRAYIVADTVDVDITPINNTEGKVMVSVKIAIKNTGQTPAHDLRVVSKTELCRTLLKSHSTSLLSVVPTPACQCSARANSLQAKANPKLRSTGTQ